MRAAMGALALLLLQGGYEHEREVDASPQRFPYQRVLQVPAGAHGQACAVLNAELYEKTNGRTSAVRVYRVANGSAVETPFVLTESGEAGQEAEIAKAQNVGVSPAGKIVFDLAMPNRAYTAVELGLSAHDFYATAKVSGSDGRGGAVTELGTYALFDLMGRGLGRSTTLPLQEVNFAVLHVELAMTATPDGNASSFGPAMVSDARVPPSREAQTLYTTVAGTVIDKPAGHFDHFAIAVAAHVPVERVTFALKKDFTKNFLRGVSIAEKSETRRDAEESLVPLGQIHRVHEPVAPGHAEIRDEVLSLPMSTAANQRGAATVDIAVDNGDDAPLPIESVRLEMRERKICFEAEQGSAYVLRFGEAAHRDGGNHDSGNEVVRAPVYDYARLFRASESAAVVKMGAEEANPEFRAVAEKQEGYMDRHPEVLWVALIAVIAVLGTVAVHNAKSRVHGSGPKG